MLYTKKENETVTSLCIFVDENIHKVYNVNQNPKLEEEIFRAIYLIIYMLTCKNGYFTSWSTVDDFSFFAARMVYMRLVNPRQWTTDPNTRKLEPVKSVLNYINRSINGMKVHYQNESFYNIMDPEVDKRVNSEALEGQLKSYIQQDYSFGKSEAIVSAFYDLPDIITKVVSETPFRNDKKMTKNLYLSILLSLLNMVTLPNSTYSKINKSKDIVLAGKIAYKSLKKNNSELILWHLDDSLRGYVDMLTRKTKNIFSEKLSETSSSFQLDDNVLDAIMATAFDNVYIEKEEE